MFSLEAMIRIAMTKMPVFLEGAGITLQLAAWTVILGSFFGILVALMRLSKLRLIRWISTAYVEFLRGTPLLVQVLIVYFGLPQLGVKMPRMTAGIVALTINSAAYM